MRSLTAASAGKTSARWRRGFEGPMLVAGHLWRELCLEATLDRLGKPGRREATTLSDRALVLVVNRLTAPGSEHGLARWLETDFVCVRGRHRSLQWHDKTFGHDRHPARRCRAARHRHHRPRPAHPARL